MERIEDRSKALSFIGIEIAEALKYIPAPVDEETGAISIDDPVEEIETVKVEPKVEKVDTVATKAIETQEVDEVETSAGNEETIESDAETEAYFEETRFETKPSLWQRIKNSKFVRTIRYIMQIRVVLDYPALPEGKEE